MLHFGLRQLVQANQTGFNGHPPLGVNATYLTEVVGLLDIYLSFNGHPPLGVNATLPPLCGGAPELRRVSMGTHPWG